MKLYRIAGALAFGAAAFLASHAPASATACSVPYNAGNGISNGQPAQASQINSNFSALQFCSNNIDNTNIGSAGLFASQIVPTNLAQATFGGNQTYSFQAPTTTSVPLRVMGTSGQTADLLDLEATPGGAPVLFVQPSGFVKAYEYYAGTDGQTTVQGAFRWGVDAGGLLNATIASNDGSAPMGVTSNIMGVFTNAGTNLESLDVSGNHAVIGTSHAANYTTPGNVSFGNGTTGGTFYGASGNGNITGTLTVGGAGNFGGAVSGSDGSFTGNVGVGQLSSTGSVIGTAHIGTSLSFSGGGSIGGPITTSGITDSGTIAGQIVTGRLNGGSAQLLPTIINNAGGPFGSGAHWHVGTATTAPSGTVVSSFPAGATFDATPLCLVSYAAAPSANTALYITSTSTAYSITGAPSSATNWACAGT
jgi:hypothetical protein